MGVRRRLDPEEVRSLSTETDLLPVRGDELCLVLESKATWRVSDSPLQRSGVDKQAFMSRLELFPLLLLLAGTRNARGRLRVPHVVWAPARRPTSSWGAP